LVGSPGWAAPPTVQDFLTLMELSSDDVARAKAGEIIEGTTKGTNDRELVATMAFLVPGVQPDDIVKRGKGGLLDKIDDQTIAFAILPEKPSVQDFAKLKLRPEDVKAFSNAEAGDDLNLSAAEIAALQKLDSKATAAQVEGVVDGLLLARLEAYKTKGLAGIAPYQRSDDEVRSAGADLESASKGSKGLQQVAPEAYKALLDYPSAVPTGTQQSFRWSYIDAHDEPTIVLTQNLYIPDGGVWIVVQRQFYVSKGYNCEQALAAFVPVKEGTAVFYVNRTSTDQVMGFGGGAKRSIGSKLLGSSLKALFMKASRAVEQK
jgi:hypothetical protein